MSIKPDDFLIYITELLNIKTESNYTIQKMIDSIKTLHGEDIPKFQVFIEQHFSDEKYSYLNGPQKFIKIKQDFEYYNRPRLSANAAKKVENYATYLFKKTCKVFDHINWELESTGRSIEEVNIKKIHSGGKPFYSDADLKYLEKIGTVVEIYNLVKRNKTKLEQEILKAVTVHTLVKYDPRNQIENRTQDQKVLDQIKRRTA